MELFLSISRRPISTQSNNTHQRKFGGKGSALIGCQMMYEAYLEDSYPPMADLVNGDDEDDDSSNALVENSNNKEKNDTAASDEDDGESDDEDQGSTPNIPAGLRQEYIFMPNRVREAST